MQHGDMAEFFVVIFLSHKFCFLLQKIKPKCRDTIPYVSTDIIIIIIIIIPRRGISNVAVRGVLTTHGIKWIN
jgi:hypothetical protein